MERCARLLAPIAIAAVAIAVTLGWHYVTGQETAANHFVATSSHPDAPKQ